MNGRLFLLVAALAAALGASLALYFREPLPELRAGTAVPRSAPIGGFALVDQRGRSFGPAQLKGRWTLVFTGFTHCPDICPTTLSELANLDRRLRTEGGGLQTVFLSVDPARDTPEVIARYLGHFGPGLIGLTGSDEEVGRLAGALGLAHVRNPGAGGEYTVDHSASLVLIDPDARVAAYFRPPHSPDRLEADLAPLARAP